MIELKHFAFAFFLFILLPVAVDFALSLLKMANRAPLGSSNPLGNSHFLKGYIRGMFWSRKKTTFEQFFLKAFVSSANLFVFSYVTFMFDQRQGGRGTAELFSFFMVFVIIVLLLNIFYFRSSSGRVSYSAFLSQSLFSFSSLILLFTGLSLINGSAGLKPLDGAIFLFSQALFFLHFKKLYRHDANTSSFERHVEINTRLGMNMALLAFFLFKSALSSGPEYFLLVILGAFLLEVMMGIFEFEALFLSSNGRQKYLEKYINAGLSIVVVARALF